MQQWIEESLLYSAAWNLQNDAGGNMKRAEKIAAKLRDKGARENLITGGLLHDISLNGEIYLVSVDNIFGSGISQIVVGSEGDHLSSIYPPLSERLAFSDWKPKAVIIAALLCDKPKNYLKKIEEVAPYHRQPVLAALVP